MAGILEGSNVVDCVRVWGQAGQLGLPTASRRPARGPGPVHVRERELCTGLRPGSTRLNRIQSAASSSIARPGQLRPLLSCEAVGRLARVCHRMP